jgi:hypothetical protein
LSGRNGLFVERTCWRAKPAGSADDPDQRIIVGHYPRSAKFAGRRF